MVYKKILVLYATVKRIILLPKEEQSTNFANSISRESFYQAFSAPARVIAANAGVTLNEERLKNGIGFNANRNKYENLFSAGIIDPVKVTKNAVLTAVSIAGLVLTTNVLVGEKEEPQWG